MSTGYGTEIWCLDSLVTGRLVTGGLVAIQALVRRVNTERGTLRGGEEESTYGLDLAAYVGAVGYPTAVRAIPGIVRAEWLKDDRVAGVDIQAFTITDAAGLATVALKARVVLADEGETFDLTLNVADGGVQLAVAEAL